MIDNTNVSDMLYLVGLLSLVGLQTYHAVVLGNTKDVRMHRQHLGWTKIKSYSFIVLAQLIIAVPTIYALRIDGLDGYLSAASEWLEAGDLFGWIFGGFAFIALISPLITIATWLWVYTRPSVER